MQSVKKILQKAWVAALYICAPRGVSDAPAIFPVALRLFEQLYNEETGGYMVPGPDVPLHRLGRGNYRGQDQYDAVEMEVGHFYYSFIRMTKPVMVLETGVSRGYSTSCIAAALKRNGDGHVYAIDPKKCPHLWDHNSQFRQEGSATRVCSACSRPKKTIFPLLSPQSLPRNAFLLLPCKKARGRLPSDG